MSLRLTTSGIVIAVALLAIASAGFRIYTAPDRIQKRMAVAKQVCGEVGGRWTVDERNLPLCQRD